MILLPAHKTVCDFPEMYSHQLKIFPNRNCLEASETLKFFMYPIFQSNERRVCQVRSMPALRNVPC